LRRGGQGRGFSSELDRCASLLARYPRIGRPQPGVHRKLPVPDYPYGVSYAVQPSRVVIVAVLVCATTPKRLKSACALHWMPAAEAAFNPIHPTTTRRYSRQGSRPSLPPSGPISQVRADPGTEGGQFGIKMQPDGHGGVPVGRVKSVLRRLTVFHHDTDVGTSASTGVWGCTRATALRPHHGPDD
jgi:hypothetical protein